MYRLNLGLDAECNQCSFPAVRNPLSSKNATAPAVIRSRANPGNTPSPRATRVVVAPIVEAARVMPNISPTAWAARARERNCPCHKYTPSPVSRGPYCTVLAAYPGARPAVTLPHRHCFEMIRCSVTCAATRGRSIT